MAASIAAAVIIATVLEPWAILIRLATPKPRNRKTRPAPMPAAASLSTKARSITGPIPVACSATPNAPLAAMIRMMNPAPIRDVSTIRARSARLTLRCRVYTHMATAAATSIARLGFPTIAV